MSTDPRGEALLKERIALIPKLAASYYASPVITLPKAIEKAAGLVITGTGSSAAHAKFLCYLLNSNGNFGAEFRPLSAFLSPAQASDKTKHLIVFSQGLSPNARIAIEQRDKFAGLVVCTAVTASGKNELCDKLRQRQITIIEYPLESEYEILLRVVGPFMGYLAALRLFESLTGAPSRALLPLFSGLETMLEKGRTLFAELKGANGLNPFQLVTSYPLSEFGENLAFKVLEGTFIAAPAVWDLLHFAHGPFQMLNRLPQPIVYCGQQNDPTAPVEALREMASSAKLKLIEMHSTYSAIEAILEYEMIFNGLVMEAVKSFSLDQRNWPGKGLDTPIYRLGS